MKNPYFSAQDNRETEESLGKETKVENSIQYPTSSTSGRNLCKFILNTQWILIKCCRYVVLGFWACSEKSFVQTEFRLKSTSFFP